MTDESIINLSDETKSSLRIYATMAGFFIIASVMLYGIVTGISEQTVAITSAKYAGFILLSIIGVILAMLHKRDLFAAFFILFAFTEIIYSMGPLGLDIPMAIIYFVLSLAFLQTRNEQRFIVVGLFLLHAIASVMLVAEQFFVVRCLFGIIIVACFYFAFALACERFKLPLRDYLVADEEVPENDGVPVHFKEMGSSIGFLFLSFMSLYQILFIYGGFSTEPLDSLAFIVAVILVITGIIMMVAGRMRGTPFYFIMIGFVMLMMASGHSYVEFICLMIIGLMMMLRSDSRILFGLGLVLMGVFNPLEIIGVPLEIYGITSIAAFLIFTYLTFAVNSNGRLKLI